jgi:hypothetical protein
MTVDLTIKRPFNDRSAGPIDCDRWATLEERLRVIEGNDLFNPIQVVEIYLEPNIVVPKKFKYQNLSSIRD